MADFDKAARYQVKQDPPGFFRWLFRGGDPALVFDGWLDTRRLALPAEGDLTCDTVAGFRHPDRPGLLFVLILELQTEARGHTLERVLDYVVRLRREPPPEAAREVPLPVVGAVVNLTGAPQPRSVEVSLPGVPECDWRFQILQRTLREEDATATLAEIAAGRTSRWLLPWIPLMRGGNEAAIMEAWKTAASAEPDARARSILAALVLTFADLVGQTAAWAASLEGWNVQKSAFLEGFRDEGRLEARRDDLLLLLRKRFGELPAEVVQRVQATTDPARLTECLDKVLDIQSPNDLPL
jgi:hypothetical protein